jgi:hypothetical protein
MGVYIDEAGQHCFAPEIDIRGRDMLRELEFTFVDGDYDACKRVDGNGAVRKEGFLFGVEEVGGMDREFIGRGWFGVFLASGHGELIEQLDAASIVGFYILFL